MTEETIEDFFMALADRTDPVEKKGLLVKSLTARVPVRVAIDLDSLASVSKSTRQELLNVIISRGVASAVDSYLSNVSDKHAHEFYMTLEHVTNDYRREFDVDEDFLPDDEERH